MSASSEKKKRQAERQQGIEKRQAVQRETEEKAKKSKRNWTIGTVLIVLLLVVILVANSSLPYKLSAVTVGDATYSAAEMNYFYNFAYSNNYYYMSMMGGSLDSECGLMENGTWRDYFKQQAVNSATSVQAMYEQAIANGYTISEEGQATVDSNMESLATAASNYGYSSTKKYLRAAYGPGMTENLLREIITKSVMGSEYAQSVQDSYTYTDQELVNYFNEHKDEYETYSYLYYTVAAETEETTDEAGETVSTVVEGGLEAAKEAADAIAAEVTDADSFAAAVAAASEDAQVKTGTKMVKGNIPELYRNWVTSGARQAGDVTVAGDENGYTVVMFQGKEDQQYNEVSVRHILIKAVDENGDGTISDEEKENARRRLQIVEDEWNAGAKTEDAFAALAEEYSEDDGSKTNGGLYEGIYRGQMVADFDAFCFAEGRKTGDTDVVYGSSSSYEGYHLVYFVGEGELHSMELAKDSLVEAAFNEWYDGVLANYTATTQFGYRLVGKIL